MTDNRPETPAPSTIHLAAFPGPAVATDPQGRPISSNGPGEDLLALLRAGRAAAVAELARRAWELGAALSDDIPMAAPVPASGPDAETGLVLAVTAVPEPAAGRVLVLARDIGFEHHLRAVLIESRQRYKDLVEVSSDFAWEVDQRGLFAFVSPHGALGHAARDFLDRPPLDFLFDPSDRAAAATFRADARVESREIMMRTKDGSEAWVLISALPIAGADGVWRGARGVCRDITDEKRKDQALQRAFFRERVLNRIVAGIRDEVDPADMLVAAASTVAPALGAAGCRVYCRNDLGGLERRAEYGVFPDPEGFGRVLENLAADFALAEVEADGHRVLVSATVHQGEVNGALAVSRAPNQKDWSDDDRLLLSDVANQLGIANEQVANHDRILRMSRTDSMTGLLNRRAFFEEDIPRRVRRLQSSGAKAALFYVDMDNFKAVNDIHGHQAGDEAILALRDLLHEQSRPGDALARLGGDEFALWLDGMDEAAARARAERMLEASRVLERFSGTADKPLGISIGIAVFDPALGESLDGLIGRADAAMYAAKHGGKGSYRLAGAAEPA